MYVGEALPPSLLIERRASSKPHENKPMRPQWRDLFVILLPFDDGEGPVNLLKEQEAAHLMGQGES